MRGFFSIFANDLRIFLKDWKSFVLLLFAPIFVLLVLSAAMAPMLQETSFVQPFSVTLTDQEESLWSSLLEKQLRQVSLVEEVLLLDEAASRKAIAEGRAKAGIVVPKGLAASINVWSPVTVKLFGSRGHYMENTVVQQIGELGASVVNSGIAALAVIRAYREPLLADEAAVLDEMVRANEAYLTLVFNRLTMLDVVVSGKDPYREMDPVGYFGASLIPVFLLLSVLPMMKMIQRDRAYGVLQRYRSTGSGAAAMVTSRMSLAFLVSFLQVSLVLLILQSLFQPLTATDVLPALLLFTACLLASSSFAMLISALAATHAAIDMIAYPGILLMAVAGGCIYPLHTLPEWVLPLSDLLPTRWGMTGFLDLFSGYADRVPGTAMRLVGIAAVLLLAAIVADAHKRRQGQ